MLTLESDRLLLRGPSTRDIAQMVDFYSEQESRRNILRRQRNPEANERVMSLLIEHSDALMNVGYIAFAVELKSTRELIGKVNMDNACAGKAAGIGWHFGVKYAGQGYATEAAAEVMKFGWNERQVSMIFADCFEGNGACQRVFEKLGMSPVPFLGVKKYIYSLKYRELRPIVRWQKMSR